LSRDHLDYHPDMAHYGATKARLFAMPGLRAAVVNLDDPFGRGLLPTLPATLEVLGTSARGAADAAVRATDVVLDGNGLSFLLHMAGRSWPVASPLLGRFNIDNLLVVAAVMRSLGHDPDSIAATLGRLQPIPGRMNRIGGGDRPLVVVDYSHKPDPLEQALQSLRDHLRGRLVCVFGCGGERDAGKRPVMAAIAERLADEVVVTDDNPRHEDGDAIVAGIMAGFAHPERVRIERDRRPAITGAITRARFATPRAGPGRARPARRDHRGDHPRARRRHRAGGRQGPRGLPGSGGREAPVRRRPGRAPGAARAGGGGGGAMRPLPLSRIA